MSEHTATVRWRRTTADFKYETFDRGHEIHYSGGIVVAASSAPAFKGDRARVNPEEAFVGALSSCHMLTFLAIAARKGLTVEAYDDAAAGTLDKNAAGKFAMTKVVLRPRVRFADDVDPATVSKMHAAAHENCFIAQSVRTEVSVEPGEL